MRRLRTAFVLVLMAAAVGAGIWFGWRAAAGIGGQADRQARAMLAKMTMDEKIAALFMTRPEALGELTAPGQDLVANYRKYPVSGVVFFAKNLQDPAQVKGYIAGLQSLSDLPLLIGVDQEGGTISRFSPARFDVPVLPTMYSIGHSGDPARAYDALLRTGRSIRDLGFNVDFAPVADIWSNPANKVIGDRAFASTAAGAAPFVRQAVMGLQAAGVASCLKHFPGHGDTATDTHTGSAVSSVDARTLRQREFVPFKAGLEAGAPMVMVAHIELPEVTSNEVPSSLSPEIVDGFLRRELGFDGVVVTDALDMGAIANSYTPGEAAVMAIAAGCDILLMPKSLPEAFDSIKAAVETGKITKDRIDQSVLRVVRMRLAYAPTR